MRERPALDTVRRVAGAAHLYVNDGEIIATIDDPSPHVRGARGTSKNSPALVEVLEAAAVRDCDPRFRAKLLDLLLGNHHGGCAAPRSDIGRYGHGEELCQGSKSGCEEARRDNHFDE
jgi:hypothetical protein